MKTNSYGNCFEDALHVMIILLNSTISWLICFLNHCFILGLCLIVLVSVVFLVLAIEAVLKKFRGESYLNRRANVQCNCVRIHIYLYRITFRLRK